MAGPDKKRWPNLHRAWEAYGHSIEWDQLSDFKAARTHNFVALAWSAGEQEGFVNYATLASGDRGQTWEMQNDSHEPVRLATWKKMRIVPHCDWLTEPEGEAS
jgi:hypothetical protein